MGFVIWNFLPSVLLAGPVATMEDIDFWTGDGENRAALVIDWDDTTDADESLVWGFRWNGNATGQDLLRAIVAADGRLFAKVNMLSGPTMLIYGVGYDQNDDGAFGIDDGSPFDADGFTVSNSTDGATSLDPADRYVEGWFDGFWHYGVSVGGSPFAAGSWTSGDIGLSARVLTDGDWDSWTFTTNIFPPHAAFAENPHAAAPPDSILAADFDADGDVDGDDFLSWQSGFGLNAATHEQGDADADVDVDGDDFLIWQTEFGQGGSGGFASSPASVPEPPAVLSAWITLVVLWALRFER